MPRDLMRQIGEAIENAARTLPEDWMIILHIEFESGAVTLENPDGDEVEFPSNCETFGEQINDAVSHAIATSNGGET